MAEWGMVEWAYAAIIAAIGLYAAYLIGRVRELDEIRKDLVDAHDEAVSEFYRLIDEAERVKREEAEQ